VGYLSPPPSPQPVVVYKDVGGLVSDYQARTEDYRRENREVRLHECRSACTLALSLPNVCVYPDARLKFHQAYNELTREADLGVSAQLFDSYPAAVRGRLGFLTRQYKVLSGVELIALGVRNCQQGDRVMVAAKTRPPAVPRVADPLREIAQNVQVAVANAMARPSDAPPAATAIVIADRKALPPTLAWLAGDAEARLGKTRIAALAAARGGFGAAALRGGVVPLPPRRPDFASTPVEPPPAAASKLIDGAQPILDASRFVPTALSSQAEVERRDGENFGG
jgi:hypothetical protein